MEVCIMGKVVSLEKARSSEVQDLREVMNLFDEIIEEAPKVGYPEISVGMTTIRKELAGYLDELVTVE